MALGENIKKLREENNLTQQQLADRLYVSRQTVCRWAVSYTHLILLTHEPDAVKDYLGYDYDMILSGHSHGGQVNIPSVSYTHLDVYKRQP